MPTAIEPLFVTFALSPSEMASKAEPPVRVMVPLLTTVLFSKPLMPSAPLPSEIVPALVMVLLTLTLTPMPPLPTTIELLLVMAGYCRWRRSPRRRALDVTVPRLVTVLPSFRLMTVVPGLVMVAPDWTLTVRPLAAAGIKARGRAVAGHGGADGVALRLGRRHRDQQHRFRSQHHRNKRSQTPYAAHTNSAKRQHGPGLRPGRYPLSVFGI